LIKELALTFRDAITVTQKLGLQYLWIDALCIIQDSPTEWHKEASQMARVYGNSHINIAATSSMDAEGGLFKQRDPIILNGCRGIFPKVQNTSQVQASRSQEHICMVRAAWLHQVERGTLNERGWVFQERLLAPRTIHFTSSQLFWECRELTASEEYPSGIPDTECARTSKSLLTRFQDDHPLSPKVREVYSLWYHLLQNYGEKQLTKDDDRLVALSGVAEVVKGALPQNEEYLAGLWRSRLLSELFWGPGHVLSEKRDRRRPSWSWASLSANDGLSLTAVKRFKNFQGPKAEILGANMRPIDNPLGAVRGGDLRLRARMCRATIPRNELNINGNSLYGVGFSLDHPCTPPEEVYLLEVFGLGKLRPTGEDAVGSAGLLLYPAGEEKGTYSRVGVFHIYLHSVDRVRQLAALNTLDQAFKACDLNAECFQEFDGNERYTIKII
jgi:hypothetical protein